MDNALELILAELQSLKEGQSRMENRLENLENKTVRVDSTLLKLETRLGSVEKGQLRLETRMENEVVEKIRGLYDDRSMNQDYFASIKDSLARIEDRVEFLARQNVEHIDKLQKHDRELRLLRAERK